MTREQLVFIQILSDHLNGRKTEQILDVDWNRIYSYARMHQVSGMIYTQTKCFLPPEIKNLFLKDTIATICVSESRGEDYESIKNALQSNRIPHFIVKGPEVATLYPIPKFRSMGDIDLVVRPDDREAAHHILLNTGYYSVSKQEDREWQYYKNGLEIELHDRLIYKENVNEKGQEEYFNDCWKYVIDGQLEWNFHFLFLVFHLRKHLMNSGAGFRHFMDLAVAAQRANLDWDWVKKNLKVTGMYRFAKKCYGFIDRWFGISTPIAEQIDDEFYENATQRIFDDGVFGTDNEDNVDNEVINEIRGKKLSGLGMIKIAIRYVFPACKDLKYLKQYQYLEKMPILLPIAWIQRIFLSLNRKKKKTAMSNLKKSFIPKERIEKRNNMLREWGL